MPEQKTSAVVVRMDAELHGRIVAHAEANERTVAQTVRLAVRQYLEREAHEPLSSP